MRNITLYQDWYKEDETPLFQKTRIRFQPGITILVGCNGSGKTTLIHQIQSRLREKHIPFISYNNLTDGGNGAWQDALDAQDLSFLAAAAQSSEGENILMNLGTFAKKLGQKVQSLIDNNTEEFWIFLDGIDSGMSIDNIIRFKNVLHQVKKDCETHGINAYIIVSANSYELARGERCLDVISGNYVTFDSYDAYACHICETARQKTIRDNSE